MISPLASPFRGGWRNLTPMRGRGRGGANPWTPVALAPYAWYDVHAGGTSSTIADTSGNGRADATYGATTAAPLYLPFTGTAYLHLEAASSGTNSLSCTAPANTASYAAYPLGGGAATTGAASAGAFAFTTAGDWTQVDLLDGSAAVLASYRASDSGQTGHTDAYSVVWAINRGTAGGKSTLVNRRSLALLRTNDFIAIPSGAMPPSLAADSFTLVVVARIWATPNANQRFFDSNPGSGSGILLYSNSTSTGIYARIGDATPTTATAQIASTTLGQRLVMAMTVAGQSATGLNFRINSTTATAQSTSSIGDRVMSSTPAVGKLASTSSTFLDGEFEALAFFDRVISSTEIAQLVTYYDGGS